MKKRINEKLADEGLKYIGKSNVLSILDVLYDVVGLEKIKKFVKKPLKNVKTATHYGCHLIRPSEIGTT